MKQITVLIRLRDHMLSEDGWGHAEGRRVHGVLLAIVEQHPEANVFRVSLFGVRRTDASFPRESVVELARRYRGSKGFCLIDVADPDLLENWDAAARKREQPIIAWISSDKYLVLGPPPSEGARALFEMVAVGTGTTTSEMASYLHQSVPNISNKTKSLWEAGYILRRERVASTGGLEFEYFIAR